MTTEFEKNVCETVSPPQEKKHSGISKILNKYFRHIDRGGTLKGEIMAGLTVFFIAICVLFMNVQMIASSMGVTAIVETTPNGAANIANSQTIATLYISSVLVAFIGSLLIGLVTRLPFVQMSMMGLSSSMICYLGVSSGLTYYNLLFINLIAAIIYAVAVSVPFVKQFVFEAIPKPVRKILPAATGLIVAYIALQMSGFMNITGISAGSTGAGIGIVSGFSALGSARSMTFIAFISCIVAVLIYFILKAIRLKHPVFWAFTGGTLIFVIVLILANGMDTATSESFLNFGRLWSFMGSQASQTTPFGDSYLSYFGDAFGSVFSNFGKVFSEGGKFADGVNTGAVIIAGVLCYLFMGMYDTESTLQATQEKLNEEAVKCGEVDFDSQKGAQLALMCNAGINIIAPFLGAGSVTVSKTSVAGTEDNGKSGLVSVVAAIGFLVSLFLWIFPFLFATSSYAVNSMNEFNYNSYGNGGFIACFSGLSFGIANAVMVCVGLGMCKCFKDINWGECAEWLPAVVTVATSVAFTNLALGVACGVLSYSIIKVCSFRISGEKWRDSFANFVLNLKAFGFPTVVLAALMLLMVILYPSAFIL